MSLPIFRTSQNFTPARSSRSLGEKPRSGTLVAFLSLLLGIAVSADADHAS